MHFGLTLDTEIQSQLELELFDLLKLKAEVGSSTRTGIWTNRNPNYADYAASGGVRACGARKKNREEEN